MRYGLNKIRIVLRKILNYLNLCLVKNFHFLVFLNKSMININKCCFLYNNNYRPIYHIERLILLMHIEYNSYKDKILV